MVPEITISGRQVGARHKPVVIAEIGINHEGSLSVAKEMVDAAINAGAEVVKHQTHICDDEMTAHARQSIPGNSSESIYDIMQRCSLGESDERKLMDYVQARGAMYISTPFSRAAADRLDKFNVPAFKIGSGECNNYPFIRHVAAFGKPMIVSTGMNSILTVLPAVELMRQAGVPFALLHCTNVYPTPPNLVRLGAMVELQQAFPDAVIGLSDHTVNNYACLAAVALGASIVERHFTDRMDRPGPDISCSMDPQALADLIAGASTIFLERGGGKGPVEEEAPTIAFAFASVVAVQDIAAGDLLGARNIYIKRPGGGDFGPADYDKLIGLRAARDIRAGAQISRYDVAAH